MSRRPLIIFGRSGRMPQDGRAHYLQEKRFSYQRQQQREQRREVTLNRQTQRTQQQIVDLTAQIAQLERRLQQAQQNGNAQDLDRLREQLEACRKSRSDLEQRLASLQGDLEECRQTLGRVEGQLVVEREQHSRDQKQNEDKVRGLESKNEGLQKALNDCEEEKRQVDTLQRENEILRKQLDVGSKSNNDLEECRQTLGRVEGQLVVEREQHSRDQKQNEDKVRGLESKNEGLQKALNECTQKLKEFEKKYATLSAEHRALQEKFDTFKASESKLADAESKLQEERDKRCEELKIANRKLKNQNFAQTKEMSKLTQRLNICRMDEKENEKKIAELKDEINQLLKAQIKTGESKIADATDSMLNDLRTQVSTLKQELDVFKTMANNIIAVQQKAEQEKDAAKRKLKECESKISESKISESKEDLEVTQLRAKVAQMEANAASWNTLAKDIVAQRKAAENDRDIANNNLADCEKTNKNLEAQLDDLDTEFEELYQSNVDKIGQIQDFAQKFKNCEDRLAEKQDKVERLKRGLELLRAKFDKLKAKVPAPAPAPPAPPSPPAPMPSPPTVIVNPSAPAVPPLTPEGVNAIRQIRDVLRWYAIADVIDSDNNVKRQLSWLYENFSNEFPDPYATGAVTPNPTLVQLVQDYRNQLYEFLKARYETITKKLWERPAQRRAGFLAGSVMSVIERLRTITPKHIEEILKELDKLYNLNLMSGLRGDLTTRRNDYPAIYFVPSDDEDTKPPYNGGGGGGGASKNYDGGRGGSRW